MISKTIEDYLSYFERHLPKGFTFNDFLDVLSEFLEDYFDIETYHEKGE
jgi:hypothetical protein